VKFVLGAKIWSNLEQNPIFYDFLMIFNDFLLGGRWGTKNMMGETKPTARLRRVSTARLRRDDMGIRPSAEFTLFLAL
jgi:hypothetical protein